MTRVENALHRAQIMVSTAVRFEDVAVAVLSGGLSLAEARGGALWVRESSLSEQNGRGEDSSRAQWIRVLERDTATDSDVATQADEHALPSLVRRAVESGAEALEENEGAWPLVLNGQVTGVLELRWDAPRESDETEALRLFCEHAALELANMRLLEQMENAKREWESTFDGMLDGICVEDENGTILRANATMARLFDVEASQVPGRNRDDWAGLLAGYEELQHIEPMAHHSSGRGVRYGEFRCGTPPRVFAETLFELQLQDGEYSPRSALSPHSDERRCLRVLRDISQQRRLEEQLIQSEKLAALGELVSGVAHELNNPLATVAGYAQLLQDDKNLPASTRRQIEHIYEEASRASRIVGNLLSFARREEPRHELLDVNDALRSVVQLRGYQLSAANIAVEEEYSNRVPLVRGDSGQLQQVFLNVINNAQSAMSSWRGGGVLRITTQPADVGEARGALIAFEDNGPGIAPDHLRRIFDPFWTTKPAGEGTGLGMSISLGIVSRHGGRIWAESTQGKGARFFIELPGALGNDDTDLSDIEYSNNDSKDQSMYDKLKDGSLTDTRLTDSRSHTPPNGARILIVDDEEPVILLISEVLSMDGHHTTPAFNGGEALALLQERDFDLILSDVRMPAVGGPTFFEILQTTRPDLLPRVIFVTGDTMSPSTQQFLQRANRPVMAKPFDPERLRALVRDQIKENAA